MIWKKKKTGNEKIAPHNTSSLPANQRTDAIWNKLVGVKLVPTYLEDHPMTCKWLITMVIVSPLTRVVGPLPNGLNGL